MATNSGRIIWRQIVAALYGAKIDFQCSYISDTKMLSAGCKTAIGKLYMGGDYSCDLIEIFRNDVCLLSSYYDGYSVDYQEKDLLDLCQNEFPNLGDNDFLEVKGMRALQGSRLMEDIVITRNGATHYDTTLRKMTAM